MTDAGEAVLSGGNLTRVVRVGGTVRREAGPWTPAVHALLRHLAARRYPAPVAIGMDEHGREVLSYIDGITIDPGRYDLLADRDGVRRAARLISDYHDAQADFARPSGAEWRANARDPSGSEEVLAHNDLAPWNLVAGPVWTYIDWDLVAPGRRSWDLAWALHAFVGLWPDATESPAETAARIDAFCEGARVPAVDRARLLRIVVERTAFNATDLRARAGRGEPAYVRLVDTGHADVWQEASAHVAANLDRWVSHLAD